MAGHRRHKQAADTKGAHSKKRITAFAVSFALAFVLPILLGGFIMFTGWDVSAQADAHSSSGPADAASGELKTACEEQLTAYGSAAAAKEQPAATEQETAEDACRKTLDTLPAAADGVTYLGGYQPSEEVKAALDACIERTKKDRHAVGFVMLDLHTGMGAAYNTAEEFYGASSIKVHRILAVAEAHPEVVSNAGWAIREMLEESDNDAYEWLYEEYGNGPLDAYLSDARASVRYSSGGRYAYYTAASFARMWWQAYGLMETVPACEAAGKLAENPYYSSIHRLLGKQYTTRSKAGWIAEGGMRAAADGGIVYDKESPYLLVIMSDYNSDVMLLDPYVEALEQAHQEIKQH